MNTHLDLRTPISQLPKRWQNAFEKRREENVVGAAKEGKRIRRFEPLSPEDAADEARLYVARCIYIEQARKAEEARQLAMFDILQQPTKRRVV